MMIRVSTLVAVVCLCFTATHAFQSSRSPPRIRAIGAATKILPTQYTRVTALNVGSDDTKDLLTTSSSESIDTVKESFDFSKQSKDDDWIGGLAWRGVVGVLCALWASNFAAAKLILAEPGESLRDGLDRFVFHVFTRFVVLYHAKRRRLVSLCSDAIFSGGSGSRSVCNQYSASIRNRCRDCQGCCSMW